MTRNIIRAQEVGFTLIEVLVAFAVLSISMATILGVYTTAFRSTARAASYATATQLAESKLNEIAVNDVLRSEVKAGAFAEEYEWTADVSPVEWQDSAAGVEHPLRPYQIRVEVTWTEAGRERSVALHTVKLVSRQ